MAGRHPETHGEGRGGIREREGGWKEGAERDDLTLFCQLTPADLSSHLPITYGAFKVASSRALRNMCVWARHKKEVRVITATPMRNIYCRTLMAPKNAADNEVTFYTRLSSRERSSSRERE